MELTSRFRDGSEVNINFLFDVSASAIKKQQTDLQLAVWTLFYLAYM